MGDANTPTTSRDSESPESICSSDYSATSCYTAQEVHLQPVKATLIQTPKNEPKENMSSSDTNSKSTATGASGSSTWSYGNPQGTVTTSTALTSHPPTSAVQAQRTSAGTSAGYGSQGQSYGQALSSDIVQTNSTATQLNPRAFVPNFSRPFRPESQTGGQSSSTNANVSTRRVPERDEEKRYAKCGDPNTW